MIMIPSSIPLPTSAEAAFILQSEWKDKVIRSSCIDVNKLKSVCGLDVAYDKFSDRLVAAAVVLSFPELKVIESAIFTDVVKFPYIPGLFSFRELPALIEAIRQLESDVDLFVCDGQGIAHPRRFGLASHLGVLLDKPAFGIGKNLLCGTYTQPESNRSSFSTILSDGEEIGRCLRTQDNIKPVFISIGHKCSIEDVTSITLAITPTFRLSETTRQADQLVKRTLKEMNENK